MLRDDLARRDQKLRVAERLIVVIDAFRRLGAERRRRHFGRRLLVGDLLKFEPALADRHLIAGFETFFELRETVDEDAVDAALELAVDEIAVDDAKLIGV